MKMFIFNTVCAMTIAVSIGAGGFTALAVDKNYEPTKQIPIAINENDSSDGLSNDSISYSLPNKKLAVLTSQLNTLDSALTLEDDNYSLEDKQKYYNMLWGKLSILLGEISSADSIEQAYSTSGGEQVYKQLGNSFESGVTTEALTVATEIPLTIEQQLMIMISKIMNVQS